MTTTYKTQTKKKWKQKIINYGYLFLFCFTAYAIIHIPSTKKYENILLTAPKQEVANFIFETSKWAYPSDEFNRPYEKYDDYIRCAHGYRYFNFFANIFIRVGFEFLLGNWLANIFTDTSKFHCAQSYRYIVAMAQKNPFYHRFRYITAEDLDSRAVALRIEKILDKRREDAFKAEQKKYHTPKDSSGGLFPSFQ